jgi:hypothetical protein
MVYPPDRILTPYLTYVKEKRRKFINFLYLDMANLGSGMEIKERLMFLELRSAAIIIRTLHLKSIEKKAIELIFSKNW